MESIGVPHLTITDLSRLIASRQISPFEVVKAVLNRIGHLNDRINAYITVTADQALEAAQIAERDILSGNYRGPLHGIPISLKDIFWTRGIRTTCGSKIMSEFVPQQDASVVERLRAAGAIIVGKTNMHEFAYGVTNNNPHYGPARNPWNVDRVSGGSSGGSAASVATSMCAASLGTDTGGSIRIPSSLCGVVGLKPTYGRVSRYGVVPLSWSLDHVGPITNCVEDAAIVLRAIAGSDPMDPSSSISPVPDYAANVGCEIRGLRLGYHREYFYSGLDPDIEEVVLSALDMLRYLGAELVEVSIPDIEYATSISSVILQAEATSYHRDNLRSNPANYGPDVRLRLEAGEFVAATSYVNAQRARGKLIKGALEVFKGVDAIVTPSTAVTAPGIDETAPELAGGREAEIRANLTRLTSPFNVLGFPAISVPCGFSSSGLPIGLQIIGKPFAEETVLRIAYAHEKANTSALRRPPL